MIEAPHEHDRLLVIKIGQMIASGKEVVNAEICRDIKLNVGEHRRLDAAGEPLNHTVGLVGQGDDFTSAATSARHVLKKETVHAVADTKAENTRGARVLTHGGNHGLVVADVTVGQKEHKAGAGIGIFKLRGFGGKQAISITGFPSAIDDDRELLWIRRHCDRKLDWDRATFASVERCSGNIAQKSIVSHGDAHSAAVGGHVEQLGGEDPAAAILDKCCVDRSHHLGATSAVSTIHEILGKLAVFLVGRARFRPKHAGRTSKGDEVKSVARTHRRDRLSSERLRLLDGESIHRTGDIEHEDEFARTNIRRNNARRRLKHECEIAALHRCIRIGVRRLNHMSKESWFDRRLGGLPVQDEIAVGNRLLVVERDCLHRVGAARSSHCVQLADNVANCWAARVDRDRDADVVTSAITRLHGHRGDARCVGNLIGVARETRALILAERRVEEAPVEFAESARGKVHTAFTAAIAVFRAELHAFAQLQQLIDSFVFRRAHWNGALEKLRQPRGRERCFHRNLNTSRRTQHHAFAHFPSIGQSRHRRRVAGDVTRTHHHREHIFRDAVLAPRKLDGGDAHLHRRARLDVRDRLREDVRPLLLKQTGDIARLARVFIHSARDRTLLHFALDCLLGFTAAHDHHHAIDCSVVGKRKGVHGLDGARIWIGVGLLDDCAREESADLNLDIGVLQRTWAECVAVLVECVERATFSDLHQPSVGEGNTLGVTSKKHEQQRRNRQHRRSGEDAREADARKHTGRFHLGCRRCVSDVLENFVALGTRAFAMVFVPGAQHRVEPIAANGFRRLVAARIMVDLIGHDL